MIVSTWCVLAGIKWIFFWRICNGADICGCIFMHLYPSLLCVDDKEIVLNIKKALELIVKYAYVISDYVVCNSITDSKGTIEY